MNVNIASGIKTLKHVVTANSPVLLVGTAIAGVITTGVLAAKAGYKARGIVDAAELEKGDELTVQEKTQLTWLCYAAPVLTGASTIAACVGVHTIHTKRHAAMAGLYAITSGKLDDYQGKAEELLGPKKTQQVANEVAQGEIDKHPIGNHEIILTGHGQELCFDSWSGRYFLGSMAQIEQAVNEVNRLLIDEGDCSLNDYYEWLGLPALDHGQDYGWSGEKIAIQQGATLTSDKRPAIHISFRKDPLPGALRTKH